MTRLNWQSNDRTFETGLDRGVFYPRNGPAVPWHGLTGMDENGADEVKAYYMDGRPYLYVPAPKEYSATIKAYTYPDEFALVMGYHEAADGMLLDSQQGEVFDLCYRTIVGDGLTGTGKGYKLHLVYNAVVAPTQISYATLGSSIDPYEFSWDIKASPVPFAGHRPTAHIIIDSRHLDSVRLGLVEDLLYGSEVVDASMPTPATLFDALSFGDTTVIVDNGDGTWTANGSYKNVSVTLDGEFVIEKIEAVLNTDGSYIFGEGDVPPAEYEIDGGDPYSAGTSVYDGGSPGADGSEGTVYDGGTP